MHGISGIPGIPDSFSYLSLAQNGRFLEAVLKRKFLPMVSEIYSFTGVLFSLPTFLVNFILT